MATNDEIIIKFKDEILGTLSSQNQSVKDRVGALRAQFLESLNQLEGDVTTASSPLTERLEQRLHETFDSFLNSSERLSQQEVTWNEEVSRLKGEVEQLQGEINSLRQEKVEWGEQVSRFNEETASRKAQIGQQEGENTNLRLEKTQLTEQIAALSEEARKLKEEVELQESEKSSLRIEMGQLSEQAFRLNEEVGRLKGVGEQYDGERNSLHLEKAQMEEQISKLSQELSGKNELADRLAEERRQLDERVNILQEEQTKERSIASQTPHLLLQRLVAALDQIEGKKSQVDILTAFLDEAAQFSARVALFVAKGDMFLGWRAKGFSSDAFSDQDIKTVHFSFENETILRETYSERRAIQGNLLSHRDNGLLLQRLGAPLNDSFAAVPLVVKGKSTAVLFADGGNQTEGTYDVAALELLVRLVALSIELLAYRARVVAPPRQEVRAVEPTGEGEPVSAPTTIPAAPPFIPKISPPVEEVRMPVPERPPAVEPLPAAAASAGPADREQELKLHNDARRFARLLVSEIKLYNEQKVQAGRQSRDLYDRLKEDIDRSREMYMKRVSPLVSSKVDYFHDELVRTLGENDPGALGSDCPGPMIGAAAE
ncbi:MAG: hypothetical protein LAO31_09520 [Acidobacteriia bacterium]|nr:hypothetical protein [Terriglobia bacterium]